MFDMRKEQQEAKMKAPLSQLCYKRFYWLKNLAEPMALTVTQYLQFGFTMDGRACTPKRVKDILSSFLHDVITEDVSQQSQSSSQEALPHTGDRETADKGSRPARGPSATDRAAFFLRVHTYSPLTWFAKPAWLSALVCARYGWVNVDVDLLQCVGCGNHLSGRMPSSFEPQVYAECCKKLVDSLKTAHSTFCCWVSHPSPDSFLRLPVSSRSMAEMEFVSLLKSLLHLETELPRIETVQIESMGLTRGTLLSLRRYTGIAEQSCDDGSHDLDDMFCSACMLAICGWASSSSVGASQLRCRYCNRSVGLWNYYTYASPSPPDDVCDESHDTGNSSPPVGTTCGTPLKSHDRSNGSSPGDTPHKSHDTSNGSPPGDTACDLPCDTSSTLATSMGDADEHSTGSDSQEEDVSGKGVSSPGDGSGDEGGEEGVLGEIQQQDTDSRSESTSKDDVETESRSIDESRAENGLTNNTLADEESVEPNESDFLPESTEEDIEQTESDKKEQCEDVVDGSEECCVQNENDHDANNEQTESDQEENVEQTENDKEEHIDQTESDNKKHIEQTESDNEEHGARTVNDKEDHVELTRNESDASNQSDTGSEVDTVDGYSLQAVKCFERSEHGVTLSHKPQDDHTQPGDVKSNNLKTENQKKHSADENECEDVIDDTGVKNGNSTVGEAPGKRRCGEADQPMEVDASEADEDVAGQRTMMDGGDSICPTGQQSLDSGQNGVASHMEEVEPAPKRRKIMKPSRVTFDPVAEHHAWCPWVLPDAHTDRSNDTLTAGDDTRIPGWRHFLEVLTSTGSQQTHSLISIVKTSPPCVGLRSIRKLFHGWTKSTTPDC